MLRMTMERLEPVFGRRNFWAVTNDEQAAGVRKELRVVPASHILTEPVGRNTAAAIGLAAIHLQREHGDALIGVVPSDSYVADAERYRRIVRGALLEARTPGNLVVLGIPPTRPETGYGYIEKGEAIGDPDGTRAYRVKRFTEKPDLAAAQSYLESRRYFWNAGMFFWRVSTFLENLKTFLPATHDALRELGKTIGTARYKSALRRIYPSLQNISVDYAVMEPATGAHGEVGRRSTKDEQRQHVVVIPAEVGWSDIGSWAAVYELIAGKPGANVSASPSFTMDASGNYFWSPKKFVAAIGVHDVVMVETDDAVLLCSRERAQDVAKVVKWLEEQKMSHLL